MGQLTQLKLPFHALFAGGSESSTAVTFAPVLRNESSREQKFSGAKVPRCESSRERSTPGTFAPGSEWSWERKVLRAAVAKWHTRRLSGLTKSVQTFRLVLFRNDALYLINNSGYKTLVVIILLY